MKLKFYKCRLCGQVIAKVVDTDVPIICCGEEMEVIIPKEDEGGLTEKHVPFVKQDGRKITVTIGKKLHPSTMDHFIEWIAIQTNKGNQRKCLKPGDTPEVNFFLGEDELLEAVYSYCNIHSLWKLKITPKNAEKCNLCGCTIYTNKD